MAQRSAQGTHNPWVVGSNPTGPTRKLRAIVHLRDSLFAYKKHGCKGLGVNLKKLVRQFVDFAAVGVIAFLIDYGILMFLSQIIGWNPVFSAFISYVISTIFNYVASMRFVFTHRADLSRRREFILFVIFSMIGLGMNEFIIWVGTASFGNGPYAVTASKLIATLIVALWNFFSRKHWLDAGE